MKEWITLNEYNWTLWVAGFFALAELFRWLFTFKEWLYKTLGIETKAMREKREWEERLKKAEGAIEEIKNTSKQNVDMFINHERQVLEQFVGIRNEIVTELGKLHDKLEETTVANNKTDCAMLRDRIGSGMRYFSKNVGADGKVHISFSDYVNMDALFQEYFAHDGNGPFKKMYEDEFVHFVIDR